MIRYLASIAIMVSTTTSVLAQAYYQLPGTRAEHISDRWYVLGYDQTRMNSVRNVNRRQLMHTALSLDTQLSTADVKDLQYVLNNNSEFDDGSVDSAPVEREKIYADSTKTFYYYDDVKDRGVSAAADIQNRGVFGIFYHNRANFYEVSEPGFTLRANPILHITYGRDGDRDIIRNTRGGELRGTIDRKIYYYTRLTDNQRNYFGYTEATIDKYDALPDQGTYKDFESTVLDGFSGYDYFDAEGYVGINVSEHVAIELGHGEHMIGNGMRSLLLSHSGDNYFYLKLNTRIWKLQYQNIWAELDALSFRTLSGDRLLSKKYMASHYLSYKPISNLEIGLFETVVFDRANQFELQYLNPIILYRVVESGLGSPDNVILGLNTNYTFGSHYQIYGQIALDELKLSELKAGDGWWGNKYGYQVGMKYYNALNVDHLDVQLEYNTVRPYTYTHGRPLLVLPEYSNASYSHHSQPLAHPLGANFREVLASARYQWSDRIYIHARAMMTSYGEDGPGDNFGNNILLINDSRNMDYGNETGQGLETDIMMLGIDISYQMMYNYYLDAQLLYRRSDSEAIDRTIDTKYVGIGLRVNMAKENIDY